MTRSKPEARPTAKEALRKWKKIRKRVSLLHQVCRLREREQNLIVALIMDILAILHVAYVIAKRLSRWSISWFTILFP